MALRTFARDNDGQYPERLDQLLPDFIVDRQPFTTDFTVSGDIENYFYRHPDPNEEDFDGTVIIMAPKSPDTERRVVGFVGGNARIIRMDSEEFQKIDWDPDGETQSSISP